MLPKGRARGRRIEAAPQLTPPLASHHQADHFETTNDTTDFARIWLVQVLKTSTSSSARSCACSKASAALALQRCVCRDHPSRIREAFLPEPMAATASNLERLRGQSPLPPDVRAADLPRPKVRSEAGRTPSVGDVAALVSDVAALVTWMASSRVTPPGPVQFGGGHHAVGQVDAGLPDRHAIGQLVHGGGLQVAGGDLSPIADAAEQVITAARTATSTGRGHRTRSPAASGPTPDDRRPCKTAAACPRS